MVGNHQKNGLSGREESVMVEQWREVTKRSRAEGEWAAPAGSSTRALIHPRHSPTKYVLCDDHLKKLYGGALASSVLVVWDLIDPYSVPCLSAKDCYPSSKCSRHISTESSWFKGNASGLVLGAKQWWLILLQRYQWGSSVSYHAAAGLENESQLPSHHFLAWSAGA